MPKDVAVVTRRLGVEAHQAWTEWLQQVEQQRQGVPLPLAMPVFAFGLQSNVLFWNLAMLLQSASSAPSAALSELYVVWLPAGLTAEEPHVMQWALKRHSDQPRGTVVLQPDWRQRVTLRQGSCAMVDVGQQTYALRIWHASLLQS